MLLLAATFGINAQAVASSEIVSIDPPALAFARYLAYLNQRSPFTESGPVRVKIDASLSGFDKQASVSAIRDTGASERSEYHVIQIEGDPMVKHEVIAQYLSAQARVDALPLSSTLMTPANYKFRYSGSTQAFGTLLYVFHVSPRKKRIGLIQGQIWIDPVTEMAVHEAGHFVKTPSVFFRRIDFVRNTTVRDGLAYVRITHTAIETRRRGLRADLTMTEQPVTAPAERAASQSFSRERDRIDVEHLNLHAAWTSAATGACVAITGLCQPPAGMTFASTSAGPHVPGSYSYTGVLAFSTGSTIRHASST